MPEVPVKTPEDDEASLAPTEPRFAVPVVDPPSPRERDTDRQTVVAVQRVMEAAEVGHECLVEIYGDNLGANHHLGPGRWIIGRSLECDIIVTAGSVSRQHAAITVNAGVVTLEDLDSTNGTYVNDAAIRLARLGRGDLISVGSTIFKFLAGSNVEAAYHEEIYRMTIEDGLTRLHNKSYFQEALEREFRRCQRYDRPLSLVMIDIDHFKQVNDTYGHLVGDHVLKEVAAILRGRARGLETVARYGGEEFAVILPETAIEGAAILAQVLRERVAGHAFEVDGASLQVTISAGVAAFGPAMTAVDDLVALADVRLYQAKQAGRNRVVSG